MTTAARRRWDAKRPRQTAQSSPRDLEYHGIPVPASRQVSLLVNQRAPWPSRFASVAVISDQNGALNTYSDEIVQAFHLFPYYPSHPGEKDGTGCSIQFSAQFKSQNFLQSTASITPESQVVNREQTTRLGNQFCTAASSVWDMPYTWHIQDKSTCSTAGPHE